MLGMTCALIGSSLYLTFATKIGLPVSTTHSIMGGVIGTGIAALGPVSSEPDFLGYAETNNWNRTVSNGAGRVYHKCSLPGLLLQVLPVLSVRLSS